MPELVEVNAEPREVVGKKVKALRTKIDICDL